MTGARQIGASAVGGRRRSRWAIALLILVFVVVTALRGRLPDMGPRAVREPAESSPATVAGLLILLSVSMLVTAVALLTRPPRIERPAVLEERRFPAGSGVWSLRRLLMFGIGVAMVVLVAVLIADQLPQLTVRGPAVPSESPPTPTPTTPATPAARPNGGDRSEDPVFGYLAATVIAMAVLMVASAVIAGRRRTGLPLISVATGGTTPGEAEPLALAAERGLAAVEDLSLSPREAIIACYAAMEQALSGAPGAVPLDSDTPSEVLARAVANRVLHTASAAPLVTVFAEARFSTHTMTEEHRGVAEQALRAVLADVRSGW
ncbi:MAG TPA: DUF4129 domain-containing protein [Mycobacterium sp.]|nr:DUF4129 domain-containing protein [Mycobacterium sp.]